MADITQVITALQMCDGDPDNCGLRKCPYFELKAFCEDYMHKQAVVIIMELVNNTKLLIDKMQELIKRGDKDGCESRTTAETATGTDPGMAAQG